MHEQLRLSFQPENTAAAHIRKARQILTNANNNPHTNDDQWEQDLKDYYDEIGALGLTNEHLNMARWLLQQDGCGGNNRRHVHVRHKPYPPMSPDKQGEAIARQREIFITGITACRTTLTRNPDTAA